MWVAVKLLPRTVLYPIFGTPVIGYVWEAVRTQVIVICLTQHVRYKGVRRLPCSPAHHLTASVPGWAKGELEGVLRSDNVWDVFRMN